MASSTALISADTRTDFGQQLALHLQRRPQVELRVVQDARHLV
jgi:hypothetical protein